jgi:Ca-activated chloride channel family protein
MRSAAVVGFFLLLTGSVASSRADEQAIIVLDASGSMWGQIEGAAKIDIARKVLEAARTLSF